MTETNEKRREKIIVAKIVYLWQGKKVKKKAYTMEETGGLMGNNGR